MTKQEIANELVKRTDLTMPQAKNAIEAFFDIFTEALIKGETITVRGFGCLKTVQRAPKPARNIRKGTTVWLPSRKEVKFIPYDQLKEIVNRHE